MPTKSDTIEQYKEITRVKGCAILKHALRGGDNPRVIKSQLNAHFPALEGQFDTLSIDPNKAILLQLGLPVITICAQLALVCARMTTLGGNAVIQTGDVGR